SLLRDVDAYMLDALGTTVDWFTTVTRQVARCSDGAFHDRDQDAIAFASEWRQGYFAHMSVPRDRTEGTLNVDLVHRKVLDEMLASPRWSHLVTPWDDARKELVQVWHDLDGKCGPGGDWAKNKQLPWDSILSTEFFGVYKPCGDTGVPYHLGIPPERVAMVAAHKWDLDGAAQAGLKTIYVPRPTEDTCEIRENMRSNAEGGDVEKHSCDLAALPAEARK
ncbi:hypothetical protein HD554DRAFT_2023195, partial [Boletus coccyginus]